MQIHLRAKVGEITPDDVVVTVQDKTFDYLMTSEAPQIRISAYLDRDWARIESNYAEVFVHPDCPFRSRIEKIIPGSKTRKDLQLPGPMQKDEQLTVLVARSRQSPSVS